MVNLLPFQNKNKTPEVKNLLPANDTGVNPSNSATFRNLETSQEDKKAAFFIQVNPGLIKNASEQGYIKELAFFYLLKHTYKNGRIYKCRQPKQRLKQLAGLSINTVGKYLTFLKLRDLVTEDQGAFIIVPRKHPLPCIITVVQRPTLADIEAKLYLKILETEFKKQAFHESLKTFVLTGERLDNTKARRNPHKTSEKSYSGDTFTPSLSIRHIAKICNISQTSAIKLISYLNSTGALKTENQPREFICRCNPGDAELLEGFAGYHYQRKGRLYKVVPAKHELLTHPVTVRKMTVKKYNKIKNHPAVVALEKKIIRQAMKRRKMAIY